MCSCIKQKWYSNKLYHLTWNINAWDTVIPLHGRHFVSHLGIFNPICIKLLQLMSDVITHNSVKRNEVSILINGWVIANYSVWRPPFCPPSWNLLSDLCQTSITHVRCDYAQFSEKKRSLYFNKWLSYSQLVFHSSHFVSHLGICNRICVNLLQLMSAVITHNSVKKRKSSY